MADANPNTPNLSNARLSRAALEALIEQAIEALDHLDGDPDLEDGDEDSCPAHDDDPTWQARRGCAFAIGSEDDAEPDDEDLGAAEDEPDFPFVLRQSRPVRVFVGRRA